MEETKTKKIGGIEINGKKKEFYIKIFPYWDFKNTGVDEKYLQELHRHIGEKIDGRFYIIAPANNVNFISDYYQIGSVRYYFLKVPYQIIKELHKVQFKKFHQPQSKSQINDLDEAIGFHFIRHPEVKSKLFKLKDKVILKIKKFESAYLQDETGKKLKDFESLAMILLDYDYDDEKFKLSDYFFAQDIIEGHKVEDLDPLVKTDNEVKAEITTWKKLGRTPELHIGISNEKIGKQIMIIYIDIYGNEFKEVFKIN